MKNSPQEDLAHIRNMMERSSRFISLSGISGIVAGILAILAAAAALQVFKVNDISYFEGNRMVTSDKALLQLILIGVVTLVLALASGVIFTKRKSRRQGLRLWSPLTIKLLISLGIPLLAGGIFCIALLYNSMFLLVAPSMLIFYGIGLISASKYTYTDVAYLGYSELVLGLVALFFTGYGLIFWAIGFGILHIVYGMMMYKKYE